MGETFLPVLAAFGLLAVLFVTLAFYTSRYKKVGPNQALVISGRQRLVSDAAGTRRVGYRIVTGGGTFLWPTIERLDVVSLEAIPIPFDVSARFEGDHPARVTGTAVVATPRDDQAIYRAATLLQGKSPDDVAALVRPMLTAELRACAAATPFDLVHVMPQCAGRQAAETLHARLEEFGLACLSFNVDAIEPT